MYIHIWHTHFYNWLTPSCYLCMAVLNITVKVKGTAYTMIAYSFGLVSTTCFNSKATPTNDINHSYHIWIVVVQLVFLATHMGFISHHIIALVIYSLEGRHTRTHIYTHIHTHINVMHIIHQTFALLCLSTSFNYLY